MTGAAPGVGAEVAVEVDKTVHSPLAVHEKAQLSWQGMRVTVVDTAGKTRVILNDASGLVPAGHFAAIMGPSGCGKSTLLETLSGRLAAAATLSGTIAVNGRPANLSGGRAAFVTQDEVLLGVLTVRETILYSVADAVVAELGLSDAANSVIGNWLLRGISGGQKRRVAIGCELVTSPSLLFLDEPTSGLDAAAAYHVTAVLRRLSQSGRTVLAVIHQPASEVFEQFDLLNVLAGGSAVFFGRAADAMPLFTATLGAAPEGRSAPDHLLHCINADFGDADATRRDVEALVAAYGKSAQAAELRAALDAAAAAPGAEWHGSAAPPSAARQTAVLTERMLRNSWRDVGVYGMRLVMYVGLCTCVGFLYFRAGHEWKDVYSRTALLFFVVAFLTFMSISAFPAFVEDIKVFTRERLNGYYGVGSFVLANTASSVPFIAGIALLSTLPVYFISNLNYTHGERVVHFVINLFMSLMVVESLMMAIAPLVPHFLMGIAAGAGLLGFFMIVTGFFQPIDRMPRPFFLYPFHYVSFQTYAFVGFMNNEFADTGGWGCPCSAQPGGCPASMGGAACAMTGADVLSYWGIPRWNKWYVSIVVNLGWAIFYRILFYVACRVKEAKAARR